MQKGFKSNLSWIFVGNVLHAVMQFLINLFVARILSESLFGQINYGMSLIAILSSICTLGFNGVIVKKFAENEKESGQYILSAVLLRIIVSIVASFILMGYVIYSNPTDYIFHRLFACMLFQLIFSSGDLFLYWFRYKYQAKIVAILRIVSFIICGIFRIISLMIWKSVEGYIFFTSLETGVLVGTLLLSYYLTKGPKLSFSMDKLLSMIKISYPFVFSAILVAIYGQTDKIMLNSMINEQSVAYYSVSLTMAGAISIIPIALIEGFRPSIMQFSHTNDNLYKKRLKQLYSLVFWICIVYGIVMTVMAKPLIGLLYGKKYLPAVPSLSLVVWYTSFSYFGSINNIYMIAENKTKWVQVSTLLGAILNVILNLLLIPIMGIFGAALASLLTQFITNFVLLYVIKSLRECFYIIVEAVLLKFN